MKSAVVELCGGINSIEYIRLPENKFSMIYNHSNGTTEYTFLAQLTHRGLELVLMKWAYTCKPRTEPLYTWQWGQAGQPRISPHVRKRVRDGFIKLFIEHSRVGF